MRTHLLASARAIPLHIVATVVYLALLGACGSNEDGRGARSAPHIELQAAYDKLEVGDSIETAEALLGPPLETRRTNIANLDYTTLTYTDVLHGKSLVLHFSLNHLVLKSFEDRALPFLNPR